MQATANNSAAETLDSLAREFQSLPIASLAPALVLLLGGLLLLIAGRHLLRPVLMVVAVLFGAMLAPSLLGPYFPGIGSVVLAVLGALGAVAFMALAWRLVLGVAFGVVAAFLCAFIAMLGVDAGMVDARSPSDPTTVAVAPADAEFHSGIREHAPTAIAPLVRWADARWLAEPSQVRTLLFAAAAGGGFVGLVVGVWLPQSTAALLTSLVGSIFTLVGALPFIARYSDRAASGVHPIAWICLWTALALGGWIFQTSRAAGAAPDAGDRPVPT